MSKWPNLKVVTKRPERIGFYSLEDIQKLNEHFKDTEFGNLFRFFLYTGCRRSEARALRVRDIADGRIALRNVKTESNPGNQVR